MLTLFKKPVYFTGNWEKETRGYLVIHHNHDKDKKKKKGQEKRGVTILLAPYFRKAYKRAGIPKLITTSKEGKFSRRFIGITLQFPNFDSYRKKLKGDVKFFFGSIYHPYKTGEDY